MVRIKIEMGFDFNYNTPVLKVEYYKTDEAYYHPLEHPNECFNCASVIDLNNPVETQLDITKKLLQTVEMSVNQLLNYKDIDPLLDAIGKMKNENGGS